MPSLQRFNGELMVDNRASGDEPPGLKGMGAHFSVPTLSCRHCGGVWVVNPNRTRPRNHCRTCDKYICDGCAAVAKSPDYTHRTIDDLTELVMSGKGAVVGGTVCNPTILTKGGK